jgi:AraC-like DNA-binding protein
MKPILRKVDNGYNYSFSVREDICPYFDSHWYYHPEVELTLIRKSSGMLFVGDSVERFNEGDVILMGSNLPHLWRSDDEYFNHDPGLQVEAVVIHFMEDFWGPGFLELSELKSIKNLLKKSRRGIRIQGETKRILNTKMEMILHARDVQRIEYLLSMLYLIAASDEYELLSSVGFMLPADLINSERINRIYNYTFNNFQNEITIREVAEAANISPNYFCRYFKSQANKTYWQFLLEVRIGYACKLLLENKLNVSEICYTCGFNNLSNFNRQFKSIVHKTPLLYQKEYLAAPASAGSLVL